MRNRKRACSRVSGITTPLPLVTCAFAYPGTLESDMNFRIAFCVLLTILMSTLIANGDPASKSGVDDSPFWNSRPDAAAFTKLMDDQLALARKSLDQLLAVKGTRTIENTLVSYDEIQLHLDVVSSQASLLEAVHPDSQLRDAAEKATQKVS